MSTYAVAELFDSIQGEGYWTGTPMAFARLSGCNLWDGLDAHRDRGRGACASWCDADFRPRLGRLTGPEVAGRLRALAPGRTRVCVTGGEPMLQWDADLAEALALDGFQHRHMESNGTQDAFPAGVTWLTLSPKRDREGRWTFTPGVRADEVKVVEATGQHLTPDNLAFLRGAIQADHYFVQPGDEASADARRENVARCVELVRCVAPWRLSQQANKWAGLP